MTTAHNHAKMGDIAETVLLPGDPLRAKYIADTFLEDVVQFNSVRNMLGFTGTYKGKRVSVMGTGMGVPSISIYTEELCKFYGVKNMIRVGTCGSMQKAVVLRDVVIAMSASTDSAFNLNRFNGQSYAPTASFELLNKAYNAAVEQGIKPVVGNILTSDVFYGDDDALVTWEKWAQYGVICAEMETAALYTIAAKYGVNALTLLTVSDSIVTHESTTPEERQETFNDMVKIALELA